MAKAKAILFYGAKDPCYQFSNFYRASIMLDGVAWPTVEHYYQAQKYPEHPKMKELIRSAATPTQAKRLAYDKKYRPLIAAAKDWDKRKEDVMRTALHAKFTQHAALQELLLSTDGAQLCEHTAYDRYWADGGGDGSGLNRLGALLMELRSSLQQQRQKREEAVKRALEDLHPSDDDDGGGKRQKLEQQ